MADDLKIKVNGREWPVHASPDTPLLYVLANELGLHDPRFGCGLAQCGSCLVLADGKESRAKTFDEGLKRHSGRSRWVKTPQFCPRPADGTRAFH